MAKNVPLKDWLAEQDKETVLTVVKVFQTVYPMPTEEVLVELLSGRLTVINLLQPMFFADGRGQEKHWVEKYVNLLEGNKQEILAILEEVRQEYVKRAMNKNG